MSTPWDPKIPFLWGSATSSHQVEGDNRANDWWEWEVQGKLKEPSSLACDQYRRYPEDFEMVSRLGHNAHRFSIEWSRLEPEENVWNEEAFEHYRKILEDLRARGIEPVVTLHHFTNPLWFARKGGWLSDYTIHYFVRYVNRVVKALGKYVRFWITINEPLIYLYHSFYAGLWPPGIKSYKDSMTVFRNQIEAHMESYRVIHHHYRSNLHQPVWVSLAHHMSYFTPCNPKSLQDRWSVFMRNWFFNHLFFDAALSGFLFFPGVFSEFLTARGCLDFLGLNYYTRDFIKFDRWGSENFMGTICDKAHHAEHIKGTSAMGWEIYPEGLYHLLKGLARYRLPILITENGIATEDDSQRVRFIRDHLAAVERAKKEGVQVAGYLYWSLLDNFEWAHGFGPRFGIVEVDYKTQVRKVRESAQVLTECCRKIDTEFYR